MNFLFYVALSYFSYKLMATYGQIPDGVANSAAWVLFFGFWWIFEYLNSAKKFKRYKIEKDAKILALTQENESLKTLIRNNAKENEKEVEQELNFFKKKD